MYHSAVVALAAFLALSTIWPGRAAAQLPPVKPNVGAGNPHPPPNPHPYRNFRYQIPLPQPAPIVLPPTAPPLDIQNQRYEATPGPAPGRSGVGGGLAPSLPGGMEITVVKDFSDRPSTDSRQTPQANTLPKPQAINLPREAAEQLATCWSPPLPPKGEAHEVTLRFAFNRSGSVIGGVPRVTYVKAGQGVSREDLRQSVLDAFKACTPLHFSQSMASSMPGYPLSIRFIGRRAAD